MPMIDRWVLWQYKFASHQHRKWSRVTKRKLRKDRVSNKARGKLNNFGFSRVTNQHVLRVPVYNGINTISQSS